MTPLFIFAAFCGIACVVLALCVVRAALREEFHTQKRERVSQYQSGNQGNTRYTTRITYR